MRIITGLVLLGCSAAAVIAWLPQDALPVQLSVVTTEGSSGYASVEPMSAGVGAAGRTFASSVPLVASPATGAQTASAGADVKVPAIRRVVPPAARAAETQAPAIVQHVGQLAPADVAASTATAAPSRASAPLTPPAAGSQRADLVRNLQRELKRVGCYQGEPTGEWNAASKKAMLAFNERLNASLPIEEPDYILLTLVQGQASRTCGQTCPAGQSMAGEGRCMPNVILAQPKSRPIESRPTEPDTRHVAREASGASQSAPALIAQPAPAQRSRWSDAIVSAPAQRAFPPAQPQPHVLPSQQPALAMPAPQPSMPSGPALQPLPGRMAIGRGTAEEALGVQVGANGQPLPPGLAADDVDGLPPSVIAPPVRRPAAPRPTAQRSEPAKTWAKHIFNN